MMRKNCNPISIIVRSKGLTWRLGLFFSSVLFLFSSLLFASEKVTDKNENSGLQPEKNTIIYVSEGSIVYGLEDIYIAKDNSSDKKKIGKVTSKKTKKPKVLKKIKAQEKVIVQNQIITYHFSQNNQEYFTVSNPSCSSGIVCKNYSLNKILSANSISCSVNIGFDTNSSYFFLGLISGGFEGFTFFTRPPPVLSLS